MTRTLKGALVAIDPLALPAKAVVFQYNPSTLTRTLAANSPETAERADAFRLKGAPRETLQLELEINAADQMETGDAVTATLGLHPTIAAIETMIYPKSAVVIANEAMMAAGLLEIIPPEAPLTLLIWGVWRTVPIAISQITIAEEEFDSNLNPIRARATLQVRVLTYDDLGLRSVGGALFLAHQAAKEALAVIGSARNYPNVPAIFRR